ncbi:MAG: insulinase family protein, partial [Acidobacteriota bacterium]|nr:insulinase family protein [Acidobacteriota bacterium]
ASTTDLRYEEILEKLYPMAAGYGVRVDRQMTVLSGRVHRDNLDAYNDLFSAALLKPAFAQDDFDRIKDDTLNYLQNSLRYQEDEELGKAALQWLAFGGDGYAHPIAGTVQGVESITLDDVKAFYGQYYVRQNVMPAIGGGYDDTLKSGFKARVAGLADGAANDSVASPMRHPERTEVLLVDKPGADASISFGFPIEVRRGEREFYALWLANSWLGEHRNSSSHLYKVIRETRGMNYGDYSYIEAYPGGGRRSVPPTHVGRDRQMFEVWIRTLPDAQAHFAIRAAMRELSLLVENGLTEEQFELTREFLSKYILHFAPTTQGQLAYRLDDQFYGIDGEGHLARFREVLDTLTREEVNAAIRKHLGSSGVYIAMVTGDAVGMAEALISDGPSPMTYGSTKPDDVLAEDREISSFSLKIEKDDVRIVAVDAIFAARQSSSAPEVRP